MWGDGVGCLARCGVGVWGGGLNDRHVLGEVWCGLTDRRKTPLNQPAQTRLHGVNMGLASPEVMCRVILSF